jgi:hypothetical protein
MFFAALVCGLALNAKTIYLNPGTWNSDEPAYFAHSWTGTNTNEKDLKMNPLSDGIYSVDVPDGNDKIIFVRMPKGSEKLEWEKKWNQTGDLDIPSDKNQYNITGWGDKDGNWSVYSGGNGGNGGGGNEGGNQGGGNEGGGNELEESGEDHEFAFIGSIGGDWNVTEMKDEYKFDNRGRLTGTLSANPSSGKKAAFVVIMDEEGNQYKTKGWQGEAATKVTLYWANGFSDSNVWQLPSDETLYIIMRKCTFKGTIDVEKVDKATYEAYTIDWGTSNSGGGNEGGGNEGGGNGDNPGNQAVDNTPVVQKAHKMIMDGQLVIIRGDKMFDATGRQL